MSEPEKKDVSELEERLRARNAELEHANKELLREIAEHIKTEKALQRSQEQLAHAQRLEAVGQLAAGIAHDFNNLLSIVLGYSSSIISDLPADSSIRADLEQIRNAGQRATELTRQLLAFGRRQVLEPRPVDLNEVVLRVDRMIRRIIGEHIELVTVPGDGLRAVMVDSGQIEQALLNLVINARDAMPSGGVLTIETCNAVFDQDYADAHVGASVGSHVVLAITDTGIGISKETRAHIFEPFFTTKDRGKGTGLGLASVFGIVKQSGGHIWFYSEPGKGTTFKLCFPSLRESHRPEAPRGSDGELAPRGSETILLVEDDAQLRTMARAILIRQGYQVLDAADGAEALILSARFSGEIALLLTDVVMPRMSGRDLATELEQSRPNMRVLFMSGYTDNAIVRNGVLERGLFFLQKPITPNILARKVRHVLDWRNGGG
jgi:two-component system cell cycle sensor histidine kinase/response regulator CckA